MRGRIEETGAANGKSGERVMAGWGQETTVRLSSDRSEIEVAKPEEYVPRKAAIAVSVPVP